MELKIYIERIENYIRYDLEILVKEKISEENIPRKVK